MPEIPTKKASGDVTKASWYFGLISSLYLATFLIRLSFGIITITFPDYTGIEENFRFGFLWAAGPMAEFVTVLFIGNLIDKYGRRWALMAGLLGGALSNLLIASSKNYYILFAVMGLHGFSGGCILVSSLALLADYVPLTHRGREIGMFDGVNLAGWGAGFFIGGILKDVLSSHLAETFLVGGALALVGFAYAFFNLKEPHSEKHLVKELRARHILSVLSNKSILLLVLPWFVIYMLIGDIFAFFPKASGQDFGISGWLIGAALAAGCIAIVLFQRGYGTFSDRFGRTRIMSVGVAGMVLLMVLVGVLFVSVPNLAKQPVETDRSYADPLDFVNGNFTVGNGTVVGGSIISNDTGPVDYQFGPYQSNDYRVVYVKAEYKTTNGNISVLWKDNLTATQWKYATLKSGKAFNFYKRPAQVMLLVHLGPGKGSTVSDIKTQMKFSPPLDILKELLNRPLLIAGLVLAAVMAGAFAPAALASLADESNSKARGMTMAVYIVMLSLGQVVGPPLTGYLMDNFGGIGFMFFLIGAGVFLGIIMLFKWQDKRSTDRKLKKNTSQEEE